MCKSKIEENPALILFAERVIQLCLSWTVIEYSGNIFEEINIYCSGIRVGIVKSDILIIIVSPEVTIKQFFIDCFELVNGIVLETVRVEN